MLLWGDVRFGNVIFGDDLAPLAVLDWDMASIGAPEHDVAWFTTLESTMRTLLGQHLDGFPDRDGTIAQYESLSGRTLRDIEWYETLALVRSTAIMTRIGYLHRDAGHAEPAADRRQPAPRSARGAHRPGLAAKSRGDEAAHLRAELVVFRRAEEPAVRHRLEDVQLGVDAGGAQLAVHAHRVREEEVARAGLEQRRRERRVKSPNSGERYGSVRSWSPAYSAIDLGEALLEHAVDAEVRARTSRPTR